MTGTRLAHIDAFVTDLDRTDDRERILAILETHIQALGFERFAYWMLWPSEGPRLPFCLTNYPAEWTAHYNRSDFKSHDIIASRSAVSFRPFTWTELPRDALSTAQKPVFHDALDFGLRAGGNIPLHGPKNGLATLTVSNNCPDRVFDRLFAARRHELHLIASYVHEKVVLLGLDRGELDKGGPDSAGHVARRLTPREIDVLAWSAKGKTRWEIGAILHVSEDTVKKHLLNACRKLRVSNKAHAIAAAVLRGLFVP